MITNLISYWKLDEDSGNAIDSHNGNDGVIYGATQGVGGKINTAYSFDGNQDRIDFNSVLIPETGDFSLSVWFKTSVTHRGSLFTQYRASTRGRFLLYATDSSNGNKLRLYIDNLANDVVLLSSAVSNDNEWHLANVTRIGDTFTLYMDGVFQEDKTSADLIVDQSLDTWLGLAYNLSTGYIIDFNGVLDEAAIWYRGLLQAEITALYNDGNGLAYPFGVPPKSARKQAIFESNIRA